MSNNGAQNNMKSFLFGGHFLWSFFRISSGEFGQKSFAPWKLCLLLLHQCAAPHYLGIFLYSSWDFWSCIRESPAVGKRVAVVSSELL